MATFVHHPAEKLGALALMLTLVLVAAPATASPVTLVSPAAPHTWEFDQGPYVAGLARLGIGMNVSSVTTQVTGSLQTPVTAPERFDFGRAQAVALGIVEATMRGPGSHAFGLVGLSLWLLWWRRRLPTHYS